MSTNEKIASSEAAQELPNGSVLLLMDTVACQRTDTGSWTLAGQPGVYKRLPDSVFESPASLIYRGDDAWLERLIEQTSGKAGR